MKYIVGCTRGLVAAFLVLPLVSAGRPEEPADAGAGPATLASGDAGTDLVVSFYRALLQDQPPTREQELALFDAETWLRTALVGDTGDGDEGTEPMARTPQQQENRRRRMAKVAAAGPLALTYLRAHKDWFLPMNFKSLGAVQVSSTFHMVRSLAEMKDPPRPGYGAVLVLFTQDPQAPMGAQRVRTIVFRIWDGKIDPAAIHLDGYQGKTVAEEFRSPQEPKRN